MAQLSISLPPPQDSQDFSPWLHQVTQYLRDYLGKQNYTGVININDYGTNTTPGTTDMTTAFQAALSASRNGILLLNNEEYYITDTITAPLGGSYFIQGLGGISGEVGTVIKWGGSSSKAVFDLGGTPLYINTAWQSSTTWQNNTKIQDISFVMYAGATSIIYAHDMDNLTIKRVYIDGKHRTDVRGAIDLRGTVSNPIIEGVTVYDIPNGYGYRYGDGSTWGSFKTCTAQLVGLGWWIGDCLDYEKPWSTGNAMLESCLLEGTVTGGSPAVKFKVDLLYGTATAADTSITVHDGTLFAAGDCVFIGRGNSNFEMNRVESVATHEVSLKYPLEYNHADHEPMKAGTIGIHAGGSSSLPVLNIKIRHCMFNWIGCAVDAHDLYTLDFDTALIPAKIKRVLYLDGNMLHITIKDPYTINYPQDSDYKFFEITDPGSRAAVFFFNWFGRLDRTGVASPYINNQTDPTKPLNGAYFGSDGIAGLSYELPPGFCAVQMDYLGIHLRETKEPGAGFYYSTGVHGSEKTWLKVNGILNTSDQLVLYRNDNITYPRFSAGSSGLWTYYNADPAISAFGVDSNGVFADLPIYANNAAAYSALGHGRLYRKNATEDVVYMSHS